MGKKEAAMLAALQLRRDAGTYSVVFELILLPDGSMYGLGEEYGPGPYHENGTDGVDID